MQVEFVDEPSAGDDRAEELEPRPPRPSRWLAVVVAAALAVVAVVVIVQRSGDDPTPQAAPTAPAPSVSVAPSFPFPTPSAVSRDVRDLDPVLFSIYSTAHDSVPAQDFVRSSSGSSNCKVAANRSRPKERAANQVVTTLTMFRELDSSAIIDQNAGLCAVQVRATNDGVVAILIVSSPDGSAGPMRDVLSARKGVIGADTVEYVQYRNRENWLVTVGAIGVDSRLPAQKLLRTLATEPALRW